MYIVHNIRTKQTIRGVSRIFFITGRFYFHWGEGGMKYFLSGEKSRLKSLKFFFCCLPTLKQFCPWGITHKSGGRGGQKIFLIKERLVWASAPYARHESFSHRGQKPTISKFIRSIIKRGHMLI